MPNASSAEYRLVAPIPADPALRLLLHTIRRMAMGGLDDAFAAHALIGVFGQGFRRPLVLVRALMAEISRCSARKIVVAPCCCPRLTSDEAAFIDGIALSIARPETAHERLRATLALDACLGVLTTAQAVSQSFADLGRPLGV